MFLALREIRRAKVRFTLLIVAVALLVFLILFQYTIQNSLIRAFVGGVENQNGAVQVFNIDGRRTTQSSSISDELFELVTTTDGVEATGSIWASTFTVEVDGSTESMSLLAFDNPDVGAPTLISGRWATSAGEVVANDADADRGFAIGESVTIAPDGPELTVVGLVTDAGINVVATAYTTPATYEAALRSRNEGAELPVRNVVAVRPAIGVEPEALANTINERNVDFDALPRHRAAAENPGVASIRQSFNIVFALFALVVPLVTGLFFLILTFQKAQSLTLLRALGVPARRLVAALLVQVGIVLGFGIALGVALYYPVSQQRLSSVALRFEGSAVLGWVAVLGTLGVVSALVSVRRVLAIDPEVATSGAQELT